MDNETVSVSCSKPSDELLGLFEKVEKKAGVKTRAAAFEACVCHWKNHESSLDSLRSAIEYRPKINRDAGASTPSAFEIIVDKDCWTEAVGAAKKAYGVSKIRKAPVLSLYLKYMLLDERESAVPLVSDSCGLAWKFYGAYYGHRGSVIADNYYINNPIRSKYKDYYEVSLTNEGAHAGDGPFAFIERDNEDLFESQSGSPKVPKDGVRIKNSERLAGNVDFNFCGAYKYFNGRRLVREITKAERLVEIAGGSIAIEAEVGRALKRSFEPWNHSLMLSTGGLQFAQSQGLAFGGTFEYLDRPDSLVYLLSRFYYEDGEEKWRKEYIARPRIANMADENIEALINYLREFGDIYSYCNQVYGINMEMTRRMIKRGKRPLEEEKDVLEYLQLANDFWGARENSERGRAAINALSDLKEFKSE